MTTDPVPAPVNAAFQPGMSGFTPGMGVDLSEAGGSIGTPRSGKTWEEMRDGLTARAVPVPAHEVIEDALALHEKIPTGLGYSICSVCRDMHSDYENATWPCPTVRALSRAAVPLTGKEVN